jgi:hypothetical protein
MLVSFVSAALAEAGCACAEESVTHIEKDSHSNTPDQSQNQDHCSHVCNQCHLSAVTSPRFVLISLVNHIELSFVTLIAVPISISTTLYRPPIA